MINRHDIVSIVIALSLSVACTGGSGRANGTADASRRYELGYLALGAPIAEIADTGALDSIPEIAPESAAPPVAHVVDSIARWAEFNPRCSRFFLRQAHYFVLIKAACPESQASLEADIPWIGPDDGELLLILTSDGALRARRGPHGLFYRSLVPSLRDTGGRAVQYP